MRQPMQMVLNGVSRVITHARLSSMRTLAHAASLPLCLLLAEGIPNVMRPPSSAGMHIGFWPRPSCIVSGIADENRDVSCIWYKYLILVKRVEKAGHYVYFMNYLRCSESLSLRAHTTTSSANLSKMCD